MNIQERALKTIGLTCGRLSSSETFDQRTANSQGRDCFHVWTHDIADAVDFGKLPQFICRGHLGALRFEQCLQRNIQSDFAAKLETVDDSLGNIGHTHGNTIHLARDNP